MNDSFQWWLIIVGIGIGIGLAWLVMGRLARHDDDLADAERQREAAWISRNIASYGGAASEALVEEVLDLHRQYLEGPPLEPRPAEPEDAPHELTDVVPGQVREIVREQRTRDQPTEATGSAGLRSSR
jgi:hypothetical protein